MGRLRIDGQVNKSTVAYRSRNLVWYTQQQIRNRVLCIRECELAVCKALDS